MSDKVHQCQHCGKYSSKTAKYSGPSNPGGSGSADEGEEPGGSDGGTYDADDMDPNGGNDNDNLPVVSKENEAKQIADRRADPTTRARAAVKARLKAFEKRDGGKR